LAGGITFPVPTLEVCLLSAHCEFDPATKEKCDGIEGNENGSGFDIRNY